MVSDTGLLARIDKCYDAIARRQARAEGYGPLELFVRKDGPGWPLYARPAPGARTAAAHDIAAVRARQRELGVPEAFEWVHDLIPDLLAAAETSGLRVLRAPLLVLDTLEARPTGKPIGKPTDMSVRLLDPVDQSFPNELAVSRAVAAVGFGNPGTGAGPVGAVERDAAIVPLSAEDLRNEVERAADGTMTTAVVEGSDGFLSSGVLLRSGDAAEIAGVATLPVARRRGFGAAVTLALARHAIRDGVALVFLSAGSDEIARVYQRVGFRRVGTACIAQPGPPGEVG
jgi:ribosomal protein S18 acetylase RimI-like enzyme